MTPDELTRPPTKSCELASRSQGHSRPTASGAVSHTVNCALTVDRGSSELGYLAALTTFGRTLELNAVAYCVSNKHHFRFIVRDAGLAAPCAGGEPGPGPRPAFGDPHGRQGRRRKGEGRATQATERIAGKTGNREGAGRAAHTRAVRDRQPARILPCWGN
jgi:hypothetical protein